MSDHPSDRLTEDHIEWVIDGQRRTFRVRQTYRFVFKVARWLFHALKWIGDSLKWAAPLALLVFTAYQNGLFEAVKRFYG